MKEISQDEMQSISQDEMHSVEGAGKPGLDTYAACAGAVLFFDVPVANVFLAGQCLNGIRAAL